MKLRLFGFLIPNQPVQGYYSVALSVGSRLNDSIAYCNVINIPKSAVLDFQIKNI